jgi:hypothetical protein
MRLPRFEMSETVTDKGTSGTRYEIPTPHQYSVAELLEVGSSPQRTLKEQTVGTVSFFLNPNATS